MSKTQNNAERGIVGLWRRLVANAPRSLSFTREGKVVIGLALTTGFAAINTGNNLLFLGWGLVLSSILISGLLSEATLRPLAVSLEFPDELRVGAPGALSLTVANTTRRPAFGVELSVELRGPAGLEIARAPYLLRLAPRSTTRVLARFQPQHRGRYEVGQVNVTTRFPFGFFVKTRPLRSAGASWVLPERVATQELSERLVARSGESSSHLAGPGEDYFDLRDYRLGDDLRRIRWRRAARTGRWVVVENESMAGMEILLVIAADPTVCDADLEYGLATLGSLAEDLLARGLKVGLLVPEQRIGPRSGERQRSRLLLALAATPGRGPLGAAPHASTRLTIAVGANPPATPGEVVRVAAPRAVAS